MAAIRHTPGRGACGRELNPAGCPRADRRTGAGVPRAGGDAVGDAGALAERLRSGREHRDVRRLALEQQGLVARRADDTSEFVASPPGVTLAALLVRRQNEIRLAEVELGALDDLYRTAVADRAPADVVDVVRGPDAVRQRFEQLQLAARDEVMAFVTAPTAVVTTADNTAEDEAVARGVRYRVVLEREMLDHEPGLFQHPPPPSPQARRCGSPTPLPIKLLIVDRELAYLPLASDRGRAAQERSWSAGAGSSTRSGRPLRVGVGARDRADRLRRRGHAGDRQDLDELDAQVLGLLLVGLNDQAVATTSDVSLRTIQRRVRLPDGSRGRGTRMQLGWKAARLGVSSGQAGGSQRCIAAAARADAASGTARSSRSRADAQVPTPSWATRPTRPGLRAIAASVGGAAGRTPRARAQVAVAQDRERRRVLERLPATLPHVGRHRVRRVAEQGDPALHERGQPAVEVVDVVAQHRGRVGAGDERRDRVVPVSRTGDGRPRPRRRTACRRRLATANQYTRPSRSGTYPKRSPRPHVSPAVPRRSTGVIGEPRHAV